MAMDVFLVVLGLVGLLVGGEVFVDRAATLARRLRVSPLVIGLTVVGFGTSLPELVTSLRAAFADAPGIAVGNVVGSNIANILLILGLAAVLAPIPVARGDLRLNGGVMMAATLAASAVILWGTAGRAIGLGLVLGLAAYLFASLRHGTEDTVDAPPDAPLPRTVLGSLAGLALVLIGAECLVQGGVGLARGFGVSEALIGLTVVAVGTSLPELVTVIASARRGQSAMALGNVIGSNIFNILGILGLTALIVPLQIPVEIAKWDVWALLAAALALLWMAWSGARITRVEGAILLVSYGLWTAVRVGLG